MVIGYESNIQEVVFGRDLIIGCVVYCDFFLFLSSQMYYLYVIGNLWIKLYCLWCK